MSRQIAYRRVSTTGKGQETGRQLYDLDINFDKEFEDRQSGSSAVKRTEFNEMLTYVAKGDTIHIQSNDRCFRNTREMLGFVEDMMSEGVTVRLHTENLEFKADADPMQKSMQKLILTNMAGVSEFFLGNNTAAIKQGMRKARAEGKKFGAANEKYKSKEVTINKTRRKDATDKAEALRTPIKAVISALPKPTYKLIAKSLTEAEINLPSGIVGEWKAAQVQRITERLNISIY